MSILNLILYFLIVLSLIGLGAIIYRKIPLLADLSKEEMTILERKKGIVQRIREINYKHHWFNFIISLEKFLRRLKIIFLKIENLLTKWITSLRTRSKVTAQKSREWIRQKEMKRRKSQKSKIEDLKKTKEGISIRINKEDDDERLEEEDDQMPLSELKKPIKEEQKWIDLIVENPKNITAYKFLGILYWKQHNYLDAKASLEMAVKLGSKDKKVKEILGEIKVMDVK